MGVKKRAETGFGPDTLIREDRFPAFSDIDPSPRPGRVTISDVADALGVTKSTVSRALNNYPDISDVTRKRGFLDTDGCDLGGGGLRCRPPPNGW